MKLVPIYRRKYDAERALAEFTFTVRSETELASMTKSLLDIVQTTLQPERAFIWMKPDPKRETGDPGSKLG